MRIPHSSKPPNLNETRQLLYYSTTIIVCKGRFIVPPELLTPLYNQGLKILKQYYV